MQQVLGFLNSSPTKVIDQFAGNPPQQNWIGVAQELEHHPPLTFFSCQVARCGRQAFECSLQPALLNVAGHPVGDGFDQFALFL